ncbi:unnamed protein product [Parnassius apollo]|uniref:(apollo) hypothetical protein n=1 Tax=Parnassius apollo TaxID=110799 RepID=A0A8S3Y2L0_PARAO|nr:unnamed protein product [Parnassius apollo]
MVKYCIVRGCTSGSVSDRKNRQKKNLRQSSLFKVPKSNVLRKKWSKALSQQLTPNQFVCEKHFREEDIKKDDRLIINEAETIIPRERWALLNDNVIPINLQDLEMDISEEQVPLVRSDINKCQIKNLDYTQPTLQNFEGNDLREDSQSAGLHHMESPEIVTANDVIISDSSSPSCVTLEEIHAHCRSILMQEWCYFAYDEELIFSHINFHTRKEDMHLTIANDLSVKVSFSQRPEIAIDDTISSIEDIKLYMETLQATILCKGTGIHYREFASNCTGQVSANEYKRWRQNPRCLQCRSLRQRLQRRKGADDSKFKVRKLQKNLERFKKRCHRLSLKIRQKV